MGDVADPLPSGAYESLRTLRLDRRLRTAPLHPRWDPVPDADVPHVLARHATSAIAAALAQRPAGERQELLNALLQAVDAPDEAVVELEQLVALTEERAPGAHRLLARPTTPLSDVALLTNARGEPALGPELRGELATADQVDLLCAFIRWPGIAVLADALDELHDRGVPIRVITTTYRGATQRRAVDELVRRYGAQVKIRYDDRSTRLHAKAWLIRRRSGFDTGYVGSSNLSRSAMLDGLEWNVRISAVATPTLVRQFEAAFETYWNDDAFRPYDPDTDAELLDRALTRAGDAGPELTVSGLEVRAHPHQERILEALAAERELHDRHRNLVVAATGTGKTVVAALDYRRLRAAGADSLLFVAHRDEILRQSQRTYREVLGDGTFGERLVGGETPSRWKHVFASVQSLARLDVDALPPFDVVVVDEFHHALAPTYRRLLDGLDARELLGLTATPERGDGQDVRDLFDGRTAFELPLVDALDEGLLSPFHYYGIADTTDLGSVRWRRGGGYDLAALDGLYTGNDARVHLLLKAIERRIGDPGSMSALGFCVSVAHAAYMARRFTGAGLPSQAVSAGTPEQERAAAQERLRRGELRCLFAVDLFNEGVDLPEVDTLLLLRPTESVTVYVQQLGRGLRTHPGKPVLTVLDLVGQHRREYRLDLRLRAITGSPRGRLARDVEAGFPFLPSGSQVVLDRVARDRVLASIRATSGRRELVREVRAVGTSDLARFLQDSGLGLGDVYRRGGSWTALVRAAGIALPEAGPDEAVLLRRAHALVHVDDPDRALAYRRLLRGEAVEGPYERMLAFLLWPAEATRDRRAVLARVRHEAAVRAEIDMLLDVAVDAARLLPRPVEGVPPLRSHARYRREEALAALGWSSPGNHQTGVAWCEAAGVDALFVTLRKDSFSPSTRYRDYPVSPELFNWESQNSTSLASPTGRRYVAGRSEGGSEAESTVVLFVRETTADDVGTAPYVCLGAAAHVSHQGEKPIAITWRLERPMPAGLLAAGRVVAS
ncbi:MAG: DUF3427 domain-containing protein [Pseudonocardia sp.]